MILEKLKNLVEDPISGEWGSEGNGVSILRTTNFNNDGTLNLNDVVKRDISSDKIKKKKLRDGDIIIEKSGGSPNQPVGRVVFFDKEGDYLCNNFTSVLRPKTKTLYPKYLHYLLFTNHKYGIVNKFQNKTTGILNLQLKRYLEKIIIPLPPLETQKKIVEILDQADTLRKKTQQIIESYDELAQSLFLDMFGDPVKNQKGFNKGTIRDLISDVKYGTSSKAIPDGKYPYLRMNNITYSGYMDYSDLKYINANGEELKKYGIKKGDLLFNRTNSKKLVGKTAIYDQNDPMIIAGYIIRIRMNVDANPYYIWGYLNSRHGKLVLNNMCKNIVGMANINAQELQKIKILMPALDLQNKFASIIQSVEQQKEIAKQSLKQSEDLFNALLQKAFKGQLVNSG